MVSIVDTAAVKKAIKTPIAEGHALTAGWICSILFLSSGMSAKMCLASKQESLKKRLSTLLALDPNFKLGNTDSGVI